MSSFFQEQAIQLPDESRQRSWTASFSCCVPLNSGIIQLPDDSDDEERPLYDSNPFSTTIPASTTNLELTMDHQSIKQDATEELTNISRFSHSRYANVPDWTEMDNESVEQGELSFHSNNTTLNDELVSFKDEIPDTKIPKQEATEHANSLLPQSSSLGTVDDNKLNNGEAFVIKEPTNDISQEESIIVNETQAEELVIDKSMNITDQDNEDEPINSEELVVITKEEDAPIHEEVTTETLSNQEEVIVAEAIVNNDEVIVVNKDDEANVIQEEPIVTQEEEPTIYEETLPNPKQEMNNNSNTIIKQEEKEEIIINEQAGSSTENKKPEIKHDEKDTRPNDRRSSVVATAAQSILGDKLDDFTEKLAFIKKNIIMSVDSDEEYDSDDNNVILTKKENTKQQNRRSISSVQSDSFSLFGNNKETKSNHRRTSSLMDVAPSFVRFMNQIGNDENSTTERTFSPSSLFSSFAGPMPESSSLKRKESITTLKEVPNEEEEEGDELFDFTKVIEIGKNVRSFSEDIVGNGFRMFNDVANRMKTSVEQDKKNQNESISAEDEWMHNYL